MRNDGIARRTVLQLSAASVAAGLAPGRVRAAGEREAGEREAGEREAGGCAVVQEGPAGISEDFVCAEWLAAMDRVAARGRPGDRVVLASLGAARRGAARPGAAADGWLAAAAPGVELFELGQARAMARLLNDRLADAVRASGGRIRGLATVVAADPDGVAEAARGLQLGLSGLSIGVNGGWRLDHPHVRALLAFAAAAAVPVYLPAAYAPSAGDLPYRANGAAGIIAGASSDSGRHAMQLIFGGVLDAAPGLQVVLARLGQAAPTWYHRIRDIEDSLLRREDSLRHREDSPRHREDSLRRRGAAMPLQPAAFYFARSIRLTTADMEADTRLFCDRVLGAGRVLQSVDTPALA